MMVAKIYARIEIKCFQYLNGEYIFEWFQYWNVQSSLVDHLKTRKKSGFQMVVRKLTIVIRTIEKPEVKSVLFIEWSDIRMLTVYSYHTTLFGFQMVFESRT
jgi:hypothetical protein